MTERPPVSCSNPRPPAWQPAGDECRRARSRFNRRRHHRCDRGGGHVHLARRHLPLLPCKRMGAELGGLFDWATTRGRFRDIVRCVARFGRITGAPPSRAPERYPHRAGGMATAGRSRRQAKSIARGAPFSMRKRDV